MLYALDTEFMENGRTIELISLALVSEDGRELYIQNRNAHTCRANDFVREHILPHLNHQDCKPRMGKHDVGRGDANCRKKDCPWVWRDQFKHAILGFTAYTTPQFLGYYCAYDWVALCQCFGPMIDLPKGWPMYCADLRQYLDMDINTRDITQPNAMPHHALSDARWIMQTYKEHCL